MSTPVQRQYQMLKDENPEAILFFQLGDFYEVFFEDALLCSRVLGITLTARHKGTDNEMPMAGVPMHSHQDYLERLIKSGYKVAVADQVTNEETGAIDRKVTRVVTPGAVLEEGALVPEENAFLVGIVREGEQFGLAYSDLSTGDFRTAVFGSEKTLLDEFHKIAPSEVLVGGELFADEAFMDQLGGVHITVRKDLEDKEGERLLLSHFGVKNVSVFGLETLSILVRSAAMVLGYLQETQKTALDHIQSLVKYSADEIMILDAQTLRHLEIFQPLMTTEGAAPFISVFHRSATSMGARRLRQWVANPLLNVDQIQQRQKAVAYLFSAGATRGKLEKLLKPIGDLERLLARIVTGRAGGRDLAFLRDSLRPCEDLKAFCQESEIDFLLDRAGTFDGFGTLVEALESALIDLPPVEITQGGIFKDGYNAELDEYRRLGRDSEAWLEDYLAQKKEESGNSKVRIKYSKNFGFCLEVSKAQSDKVPESWVRRQTLVNAERFTTPELAEYEEKVLGAQKMAYDLEHQLFQNLRDQVCEYVTAIGAVARAISEIDVILTFSLTASKGRWNCPEVVDGFADLVIREGRHPVVEKVGEGTFISNDIDLFADSSALHLITGPNMAGKSTYLRQNALIILLAQIGCFVPAKSVVMGVYDRIFTRVGASDNLAGGLSTFFVEMMETATILNAATDRSFVILDEIGRGTSTFDGISLAWAIVDYLHDRVKCHTLFATHYHELIDLVEEKPRAKNYHISVSQNQQGMVFLRKIVEGGISDSFGIEVARSAGVPKEVIKNAREVLVRLESENLVEEPNLFSVPRVREKVVEVQKESEVEQRLAQINPDDLTPKQALEEVYGLKGLLGELESRK